MIIEEIPEFYDWIVFVDTLANGDFTKHNEIYNLNYQEAIMTLASRAYRDRYYDSLNKNK